jgi:hypothetical protein
VDAEQVPAANLISGGVLTPALPALVFYLKLRARSRPSRGAKEFAEDLTGWPAAS